MLHEELERVVVSSGELKHQILQATQPLLLVRLFSTGHKVVVEVSRYSGVRQFLEELFEQASDSVNVSVVREIVIAFVHLGRHALDKVHLARFPVRVGGGCVCE